MKLTKKVLSAIFVALQCLTLSACGKITSPQALEADRILLRFEKGQPIEALRHSVEPSNVPEKCYSPASILAHIKNNNLPTEDQFAIETASAQQDYNFLQFLPRVYANVNVNYPIFGYEVQYYNNQDAWDRIYTYFSVVWNANIITHYKNYKKADVERTLLQMKQRINREQVLLQALALYYQIIAKNDEEKLLRDGIALKEKEVAHLRKSTDSGFYSPYELSEAESHLRQMHIDIAEKQHVRQGAIDDFKNLLEIPPLVRVSFEKVANNTEKLEALDLCLERALTHNVRIAPARLASKSLREAEDALKYERFSNFNIFLGLPQMELRKREYEADNSVTLGFNWSIPVFDAGESTFRFKEVSIQKRRLALKIQKDLRLLQQQVAKQHRECEYLANKIQDEKKQVLQKQKQHEHLLDLAGVGQARYVDILSLEQEIAKKEQELTNLEKQLIFSHFKLDVYTGKVQL